MTTVTISAGGQSATLVPIRVPDRPLCSVGLSLLANSLKRAEKAMRNVGLDTGLIQVRTAECEALQRTFQEGGPLLELGIHMQLVPTLRAALAIEYDAASKVVESQTDLMMETEEADTRVKQLGRLLSELDMAKLGGETTE